MHEPKHERDNARDALDVETEAGGLGLAGHSSLTNKLFAYHSDTYVLGWYPNQAFPFQIARMQQIVRHLLGRHSGKSPALMAFLLHASSLEWSARNSSVRWAPLAGLAVLAARAGRSLWSCLGPRCSFPTPEDSSRNRLGNPKFESMPKPRTGLTLCASSSKRLRALLRTWISVPGAPAF